MLRRLVNLLTFPPAALVWPAAGLLLLFVFFGLRHGWWLAPFWDNGVYARAVAEHLAGGDAYRVEPFPFFPFVYHPFVLRLFLAIEALVPLWWSLLAIMMAAAAYAGRGLSRAAGLGARELALALTVSACFLFFGLTTFASGNLVGTLDFLLIGLCLANLRRHGRVFSGAVLVVIVLGAVVKPYLLAYLGLLLLDRRPAAQVAAVILGGTAAAAAIWLAGFWLEPELMGRYVANIADLQSPGRMDIGFTLYGLARTVLPGGAALALHVVVMGGAALWLLPRLWRAGAQGMQAERVLALGWLMLTLLNPRMKDYDIGPALLFAVPMFWSAKPWLRGVMTGTMLLLWLPMLIVIGAALAGHRL